MDKTKVSFEPIREYRREHLGMNREKCRESLFKVRDLMPKGSDVSECRNWTINQF